MTPPHGGRIGNPPFVPTDEQRRDVRTYAKIASQETIAVQLKISVDTLQKHFKDELEEGQAEAILAVGGGLLAKALKGDGPSQRFYLATRAKGAYSRKVEVEAKLGDSTSEDGQRIVNALVEMLGNMADDKKREIIPELGDEDETG